MDGLFDEEFEFETDLIENIKIKLKPRDMGQIDSQVHLTVWPAASELCKQSQNFITYPCKVLELGAGTGLVGIYIAKNFLCDTIITDGNSESVDLIKENIFTNSVNCQAEVLVWGNPGPVVDVIVGSDIVYSKSVVKDLISTIKQSLKENGTCYLANHFIRFGHLQEYFYQICEEFQLDIEKTPSITDTNIIVISITHTKST